MNQSITQITQLLTSKNTSQDTLDQVFELMYNEIKHIANIQLNMLKVGQTITPTVLVNECYLKLIKPDNLSFENRKHFIYTVARCMRHYLVDRVKYNFSKKRDGVRSYEPLSCIVGEEDINFDLLDLNNILDELDKIDPSLAELAVLRFFSGHSLMEIADIQNISKSTIMRKWKMTKSFIISLKQEQA